MTEQPPPDHGTVDVIVALMIALFAAFGGVARQLIRWEPGELLLRKLGGVMTSVFAALIVGLYVAQQYPGQLGIILPSAGLASWGGAEAMTYLLGIWLARLKAAAGGNVNGGLR